MNTDSGQNRKAAVVVVRREAGRFLFLLLRVYSYWDFPKGLVEPGEDIRNSALREVEEETGLRDLRFHWGFIFRETAPYGRGKVARYHIAESGSKYVHLGVNPELDHPEHHEFRCKQEMLL